MTHSAHTVFEVTFHTERDLLQFLVRSWAPAREVDNLTPGRGSMGENEARGRADAGMPVGNAGGYLASMWASGAPETRYAKSEDGYVAYQVFGRGPYDLLFIGNWASNVEVMWEHPSMVRYRAAWATSPASSASTSGVLASPTPYPWARCRRWSTGWTMLVSSWTLLALRRPP